MGTLALTQCGERAHAQLRLVGEQPFENAIVVESRVPKKCEGAAQGRDDLRSVLALDDEAAGYLHRVSVCSALRGERALSYEFAHLGSREAQPLGEFGNGKPIGLVSHASRLPRLAHREPRGYSHMSHLCHFCHTVNLQEAAMAPFTPPSGTTRTSAISATAVISATGLFATPAFADAQPTERAGEARPVMSQLALSPESIERALAPAAAPVVIASAAKAVPVPSSAKAVTHTVKRGDTVWDLARHYGSTVTAIVDANGLDARATIHVGETLTIPHASKATAATRAPSGKSTHRTKTATHTVKPGDTVWDLAQHFDTTVSAIVNANGLGSSATIHVGDKLSIPGAAASAVTKAHGGTKASAASGKASARYTVKAGDTLSRIASTFGTSLNKLARANGIDNPSLIRVGQVLTIPGGVPTGLVGDTFAGRTYSHDIVSAANSNKSVLLGKHVPSKAQMRALVVKTAKKYGVRTDLALAIAYQESGFNMTAVSPANAVGTMQVIPSTGEWVSTMVGRDLDLLDPEDNVTAGVVLLHYLTKNADSLDQAIAGYYQGLGGVRKNGMNPDTKQYVASVRALMKKFD